MQNLYEKERFENFPVAMAYVPWQRLDKIYENLNEALREGTLFPELNKPYTGRRYGNHE